ncbi:S-norcoclaurine synthase 1 [Setaria italica]|uniref:S-norcoclaurine synthase 1 n=1 Tax=Setaria italica TaxID=4555 RepID=UPI0007199D43|nr:S-norcoclaurine synthase 1 [Setaria italica]
MEFDSYSIEISNLARHLLGFMATDLGVVPVHPLPGALVVNVGDVLTNGAYASVKHMVVLDAERSRTTVAMFHDACVGGLVTPLPELLRGCDTRPRYRYIRKLEYRNGSTGALAQRRRR